MNTIHGTQLKSLRYLIAGSLVALTLAGAPPAVDAADATDLRRMVVSYADLNIDSRQGARVFYARLSAAATHVCGRADPRDLVAFSRFRQCYRHATDSAVAQVNKPAVSALYAQIVPRSP